jgi:hypothetical protein
MPTYTIELEDGRKVKVQASNPDDAVAEANSYAASNPRKKPNYTPPKRKMDTSANLQTLFTQGVTFGQSPRITGAMGAVMGLPDAIRQGDVGPIAEAYRQNRQAEIDRIDNARAQTGLAGMAIETLGGLGSGGAIAKAGGQLLTRVAPNLGPRVVAAVAPRSGPMGGKVVRATGRTGVAAGGGAASGYVYGSGEGRATENALYGAVGGVAAEPIIRVGGATFRGARRLVGKDKVRPEVKAARKVVDKVRPDAQALIDEANRLGLDPLPLLDVMRNSGKRTVRAAAMVGDEPQDLALRYQATTRAAAEERGQNVIRKMTGGDVDFPSAQATAQKNIETVDDFNYGPIENQRIMVTPEMLQSLRPSDAQAAIANARRVAELGGRQDDVAALDTITNILRTGDVSKMQGLEVSTPVAEQIYRTIRDATSELYGNAGTRTVAKAMGGLRDRFDTALQAQSPQIAQARAASREARQGAKALDIGFGGFAPSRLPAAFANDIGALPQSALPNVRVGGQAQLQQQLGQNPLNALNNLAYQPNMPRRLNAMAAPAEDITRGSQIELDRLRNAAFISPNIGSKSTPLAQDLAENSPNVSLTPYGIATKLMDFAYRRINSFTEAEMEAIVRLGVDPADLPRLQALAARDPDQIPSIVKGLIGSQVGIQTGNQSNAMARYQAGQ